MLDAIAGSRISHLGYDAASTALETMQYGPSGPTGMTVGGNQASPPAMQILICCCHTSGQSCDIIRQLFSHDYLLLTSVVFSGVHNLKSEPGRRSPKAKPEDPDI